MYNAIEKLCEKFAPYVTGNFRDNHLNIYIRKESTQCINGKWIKVDDPSISCFALGKVNWSGTVEKDLPFYEEFRKVLDMMPEKCCEIHVEYFCGRINKINKEFDD